jgi:hypothetical protein
MTKVKDKISLLHKKHNTDATRLTPWTQLTYPSMESKYQLAVNLTKTLYTACIKTNGTNKWGVTWPP